MDDALPSAAKGARAARDGRGLLLLAALVTIIAWQVPFGQLIVYPFTMLATYAHEMGHGLTALVVGAEFHSLVMHADGSGLAQWSGNVGRIGRGLIAAGGLVGPSIAGAVILASSKRPRRAPLLLVLLGAFMGISALLFVRNLFGFAFVGVFAASAIAIWRFVPSFAPFFVQLVGVQLCLSVFRDLDYMFSGEAIVGGVRRISDSGAIAEALFLPYWFWGGLVAVFSFAVLAGGLYIALKNPDAG